MVKRVQLPDGTVAEFPDNTSNEKIKEVVRRQVQGGGQEQEQEEITQAPFSLNPMTPEQAQQGREAIGDPQSTGGGFLSNLRGIGEAGLTLGSGAAGQVAGGISGLGSLVGGMFGFEVGEGGSALERAANTVETVQDAISFEPKSQQGRILLQNLSRSPKARELERGAQSAGGATLEATGSPAAATIAQLGVEGLPSVFTGGSNRFLVRGRGEGFGPDTTDTLSTPETRGPEIEQLPVTRKARKKDIKRVTDALKNENINASSARGLQRSVERVAERIQQPGFAESADRARNAIVKARIAERDIETSLWNQAREGDDAFLPQQDMQFLNNNLRESVSGYLIEEMPSAQRLLNEFNNDVAPTGSISEVYDFRKKLNNSISKRTDTPEDAALISMKGSLDSFIQNAFSKDMIRGDPQSVQRWREAINKSAEIRELFEDDKVVRQFARNNATPEELRNYLFNASSVGAKAGAKRTLDKMKRILGEDSEEMVALRQESMFNLVEPLIQRNPNYEQFLNNYDKFVKKNPAYQSLFTKNAKDQLRAVKEAVEVADKDQTLRTVLSRDPSRAISTMLFGHGIARAGLKVRLATDITNDILKGGGVPRQKEIMRNFLGYDPTKPIFSDPAKRAAAVQLGIQSVQQQQQENNEEGSN